MLAKGASSWARLSACIRDGSDRASMVCEYRKLAPILCPYANGGADYIMVVKHIKCFWIADG